MSILYYDAVVVGSGAAGYSAAIRLKQQGKNVAIVTENRFFGTSRNTGSDKQTYYKLSLSGGDNDSVLKMAENLFFFGGVDGDNAICEAALSARCFFSLVEAGVPFPSNRMGEYVGYKTDHDPYQRATSAGPLTSKIMTECLEKKSDDLSVPVIEMLVVEILKIDNGVCGVLLLDPNSGDFTAVCSPYVVLATGGPASIYSDSVYPSSQYGALGLAVAVGATLQNLTEWQYGMASVNPKWNVSGSYMQVLPRFVSIDKDGNEYEFLLDYFSNPYEALSTIFLKGYQWPFDCNKVLKGSSVIDLLVFYENIVRKRRVYLDFTKNPFALERIEFDRLSKEAYEYLQSADALLDTPIERLMKMNQPAYELYLQKGKDIAKNYLEITLSAQHHNGGIAVDMWWQTSVEGLFAVGECAGTHGIARPGGSALNAGQVGALRAAQYISSQNRSIEKEKFLSVVQSAFSNHHSFAKNILNNKNNVNELIDQAKQKMSSVGAAIREGNAVTAYLSEVKDKLKNFNNSVGADDYSSLSLVYKFKDMLLSQLVVLTAFVDYDKSGYSSRGSAIICDRNGFLPDGLDEKFRFRLSKNAAKDSVQEFIYVNEKLLVNWRKVRPLAVEDSFFENVWRRFRENSNIY